MTVTSGLFCPVCLFATRTLSGTYRTAALPGGQCTFTLELSEAGGRAVTVVGAIAFQGLVLMFQSATEPGLAVGLALRDDALRGQ
jgi:hypothetical protein